MVELDCRLKSVVRTEGCGPELATWENMIMIQYSPFHHQSHHLRAVLLLNIV